MSSEARADNYAHRLVRYRLLIFAGYRRFDGLNQTVDCGTNICRRARFDRLDDNPGAGRVRWRRNR